MPARDLSCPVFDAEDHFDEPQEALTRRPDKRTGVIDCTDVKRNTN